MLGLEHSINLLLNQSQTINQGEKVQCGRVLASTFDQSDLWFDCPSINQVSGYRPDIQPKPTLPLSNLALVPSKPLVNLNPSADQSLPESNKQCTPKRYQLLIQEPSGGLCHSINQGPCLTVNQDPPLAFNQTPV